MPVDKLAALRRLTNRRRTADTAWQTAIRELHAEGVPLRQIGAAAGVSHVRVLQIAREPSD